MYAHICKNCEKQFKNYKKDAVYCSNECRLEQVKKVLSSKQKNITGQKFGRLTALYSKSINKRYSWLCKCDCGNEVWVTTASLINGHTQSCGCLNKDFIKNNANKILNNYRKENFKENTSLSNIKSQTLFKNNSSGRRGVYQRTSTKKWIAKISFQGKTYSKSFDKKEDAIKCREEWEEKYFKPILEKYN